MLLTKSSINKSIGTRGLLWRVLDWVYPPFCCGCGQIGEEICPACWESIRLLAGQLTCVICGKLIERGSLCPDCRTDPPAFDQLKSWALYEGAVRSMVTGIKFERKLGLIPYLIEPLTGAISSWGPKVDWITAVPLGRRRQHERGYNQSALIAEKVAGKLKIPYSNELLFRVRETHSQVGLNADERQQNMVDAFTGDPAFCRGKAVLLIDDIATTGATLDACAKALRAAGAEKIFCFTVARTDHHPISNPIFTEVSNERQS